MSLRSIQAIPGLAVRVKIDEQPDPENPDQDLLEITGLPLFESENEGEKFDLADALRRAVIDSYPVPKHS
jgi:hypothetical protein